MLANGPPASNKSGLSRVVLSLGQRTLLAIPLLLVAPLVHPAENRVLKVCPEVSDIFFSTENGTPRGIEHDILADFARDTGRTLKIVWGTPDLFEDFEGYVRFLETCLCDVSASTVTHTKERERFFDFSEPYFPVRVVLVEPQENNTEKIESLAGMKIAAPEGSYYMELLKKNPKIEIVPVTTTQDAFSALVAGKAQALACDSWVAIVQLRTLKQFHVTLPLSEQLHFAFPMAKGSKLKKELDDYLRKIKENGHFYRILTRYIDPETADILAKTLGAKKPQAH